jgi:hypothetical protein
MTFEAIFFWVCLFTPLLNLLWIAPCCSSFESQPTERVHTRELLRIHLLGTPVNKGKKIT